MLIFAGVIPARRMPDGWKLLILRAYRKRDLLKGRIGPGEVPLAAAKRGANDLSRYRAVRRGQDCPYYLAVTRQERITLPVSPELGRPEHHEGRWVSLDDWRWVGRATPREGPEPPAARGVSSASRS